MSVGKAVYDSIDTRCNLYELADKIKDEAKIARITKLAKSVGCLVWEGHFEVRLKDDSPWYINKKFFDSHKVTLKSYLENEMLNSGYTVHGVQVRFEQEPCLGRGTAFLIGKDLILTPAHCIFDSRVPIKKRKLCPNLCIFDFEQQPGREFKYPVAFEHENVYKIQGVFAHNLTFGNQGQDWAILKLDREVKGRDPLKINFSAEIKQSKNVWALGHPKGLPIKWCGPSKVMSEDSKDTNQNYFETDLSLLAGGSPVFYDDDSEEVIGMSTRGPEDYEIDENQIITERKNFYENSYEKVLKMSSLFGVLNAINCLLFSKQPFIHEKGLSLEVDCKKCNQLMLYPLNFPDKIDIAEACCKATCSKCGLGFNSDDVKALVFSNCTFEMDAKNTNEQKVFGTFNALQSEPGEIIKLTQKGWYYMELKVRP